MKTLTLQDIKTQGSKVLPLEGEGAVPLIVNSKIISYVIPAGEYDAMASTLEDMEDYRYYLQHKDDEMIDEKDFWKLAEGDKNEKV